MAVPFIDLKKQYAGLKDEILSAVDRVFESTEFVLGREVATFEEEFANYCGSRYGIAVNTGTSALHLALLAGGVGPGDEVITVPFTFVATTAAITYAGAKPVFVDVDPVTCTMDPAQIESAITPRTKAILPVHLYGHAADMDSICCIAHRHGLLIVKMQPRLLEQNTRADAAVQSVTSGVSASIQERILALMVKAES